MYDTKYDFLKMEQKSILNWRYKPSGCFLYDDKTIFEF